MDARDSAFGIRIGIPDCAVSVEILGDRGPGAAGFAYFRRSARARSRFFCVAGGFLPTKNFSFAVPGGSGTAKQKHFVIGGGFGMANETCSRVLGGFGTADESLFGITAGLTNVNRNSFRLAVGSSVAKERESQTNSLCRAFFASPVAAQAKFVDGSRSEISS